jgi:outer membrane receptor protein involved in Fe transport
MLSVPALEPARGSPLEASSDKRTDSAWSGDVSGLVRLLPEQGVGALEVANAYASWKSSFKPAAPNLTEAEEADILEPERTHSVEIGLKTRAAHRQVALDASWFNMTFRNMVVSTIGSDSLPELVNAGKERFRGFETSLTLSPDAFRGLSLGLGYAHHDARFIQFTFFTPDGQFRDVSGKHLELVPNDIVSARLSGETASGLGAFAALRHMGQRPLNRRNTFFVDPYTEWDAGASYHRDRIRVGVSGRNLGNDRHVVTESELGDSQFYLSPPRRILAELTIEL